MVLGEYAHTALAISSVVYAMIYVSVLPLAVQTASAISEGVG